MVSGRVKWFSESKGFGFVEDLEGRTIYFHYTAIKNKEAAKNLKEGSDVTFEVCETEKGPEAFALQAPELQG